MSRAIDAPNSDHRPVRMVNKNARVWILTETDTDQGENEELRDDQEGEVAGNDGTVQTRVCERALVLADRAHDAGQEKTENGRDSRRRHTGHEGEAVRARALPVFEEPDVLSDGR